MLRGGNHVFSIFSCGCNHYKSIHFATAKIRLFFHLQRKMMQSCRNSSAASPPLRRRFSAGCVLRRFIFDCSSILLRFQNEEESKNKRRTIREQHSPRKGCREEARKGVCQGWGRGEPERPETGGACGEKPSRGRCKLYICNIYIIGT